MEFFKLMGVVVQQIKEIAVFPILELTSLSNFAGFFQINSYEKDSIVIYGGDRFASRLPNVVRGELIVK